MSDQPKPTSFEKWFNDQPKPSTGEWTADDVKRMATLRGDASQNVADAHNAALAAAQEQLREERAKFHGDDYADMDAARNRILDLEQQLSAKQKELEETTDTLHQQIRNDQQQLAAEREKIKQHWIIHDLASQREQTLVDALQKYMVAMDAIYNHNEAARTAVVQHFGTLHPPTAFAELAKLEPRSTRVKEGK